MDFFENVKDKIKKKLIPEPELIQNFEEAAEITYRILKKMVEVIEAFCNGQKNKIEQLSDQGLEIEIELHQIYYDVVEQMYTRKSMNFSREDRHIIISKLLDLGDLASFIIRRVKAHHPQIDSNISDFLLSGIPYINKAGTYFRDLIVALFHDFKKAEDLIWKIHLLQRDLWDYEIKFFKNLYQHHETPENITYLEIIERNLRNIIMIMVRFSDRARALILKYTI